MLVNIPPENQSKFLFYLVVTGKNKDDSVCSILEHTVDDGKTTLVYTAIMILFFSIGYWC